ncbi:MAG: ABC transporter substrate-binding protein [Candidatus Planktophila sp.]|nr:ABC transporter substrate-binding protein [Candidatus Planktophila sp.]
MRKRGVFSRVIVASITFATLTGCSQSQSSNIEINSADAISITSEEKLTSRRIIALANGSAEIISALGYKENLIGRDIASTDADLKSVPVITSGHVVIAEKVISLNPDLVLIDKATGPAGAIAALKNANILVKEIPEAWQLSDISTKVASIADAIGAPKAGDKLAAELQLVISSVKGVGNKTGVTFLYLRGGSAIYLVGGKGSGADSLLSAIGAVDVGAALLPNPFNPMSSELMVKLNPDVILVMSKGLQSVGGIAGLTQLPGIAQTRAGKSQRIIAVDDSLLLSFGPRTPDLLTRLAAALTKVIGL